MKLEQDLLNEIVGALRAQLGGTNWGDRRTFSRVPMHKCIAILPRREGKRGQSMNVWVRDLSAGGIGIVHSQRMEEGDHFVVRLPRVEGTEVPILCQVTHSSEMGPELFSTGAKFLSVE